MRQSDVINTIIMLLDRRPLEWTYDGCTLNHKGITITMPDPYDFQIVEPIHVNPGFLERRRLSAAFIKFRNHWVVNKMRS